MKVVYDSQFHANKKNAYLDMILITDFLKVRVFSSVRNFHVHTCTHSSTKICWARGEISSRLILLESQLFIQLVDCQTQATKYRPNVASFQETNKSFLAIKCVQNVNRMLRRTPVPD